MTRNRDYVVLSIVRPFKDKANVFFSIGLPVIMYLVIGAAPEYGDTRLSHGTASAYILVGIALYGGVTAAVSTSAMPVVDHFSGWGRMLGTTPLSMPVHIITQAISVLLFSLFPVLAVFLTGYLTGAQIDGLGWFSAFFITWAVSVPFGFYGLIWAQLVPTPTTIGVAATTIVLLGFAGNVLMPLSKTLLDWSIYTPMFGAAMLARYPVAENTHVLDSGFDESIPMWMAGVNLAVWSVIFVVVAVILSRRDRNR